MHPREETGLFWGEARRREAVVVDGDREGDDGGSGGWRQAERLCFERLFFYPTRASLVIGTNGQASVSDLHPPTPSPALAQLQPRLIVISFVSSLHPVFRPRHPSGSHIWPTEYVSSLSFSVRQ